MAYQLGTQRCGPPAVVCTVRTPRDPNGRSLQDNKRVIHVQARLEVTLGVTEGVLWARVAAASAVRVWIRRGGRCEGAVKSLGGVVLHKTVVGERNDWTYICSI